jgi:UDP-N-acetylglucosamine acyltransferase
MLTSLDMNAVHPSAVVDEGVVLGEGNVIGPYVVILGPATIGDGNWFGPHVVVGTPAEIRGIDHGDLVPGAQVGTGVRIGSRNVFREYTTVHQGHYAVTLVGDDCYLMNKVYIGHDNDIGDGVTMASSATLGGHIHVGPGANLGMGVIVHQRRVVGPGAMVGMGAVVTRDVPPYAKAYGSPARVRAVNEVGMRRSGISEDDIAALAARYDSAQPAPDAWAPPGSLRAAWDWWLARAATG